LGFIFVILFLKLNIVTSSLLDKLRQVDYVGTVLFVGSVTSFLIPLSWGGVIYDWNSWRTLVPLIVGVVALVVFSLYEYRVAADPIIPPSIFRNRTAIVSFIGCFLQGLILWCVVYFLPLYYEGVKGYSPILSGIALFPETFTVAPSAFISGITITITGHYRWATWFGWTLGTIGAGLLCILKVDTSVPGWVFLNLVGGLGLGILFPALTFAVQASSSDEHLAMAVAMSSFFRSLGQAVGVAIGGVIFQNRMRANLLGYPELAPMADTYSRDAASLVQVLKAMPDGLEKTDLKVAYTDSLRIVWAICCAISGVALLLSLLTERYDLNRALATTQGLRTDKSMSSDEEKSNP
jgi:MFS family permease